MKRIGIAALLCLGLSASLLYAQSVKKPVPRAEYDLKVGDKSYEVIADTPFTIETANGEKVQLTLHRKEVLKFDGYGIKFNYPSRLKLTTEEDIGFVTITADGEDSTVAFVQVYSVPTTPAEVLTTLVSAYKDEFHKQGAKLKPTAGNTISASLARRNAPGDNWSG
jgi:hypothetical protein